MIGEFHRRIASPALSRWFSKSGICFDDDVIALLTVAYNAVLKELR
jgi:hypothetical protein